MVQAITFFDSVLKAVKISTVNYSMSDDELRQIIEIMYNDLLSDVSISQFNQKVILDENIEEYDLDKMLYFYNDNETTVLDVYAITTRCGIDISKCFKETCRNTFCLRKDIYNCDIRNFPEDDNGDKVVIFKRHIIPDISMLTKVQKDLIYNALILGVIERVQYMLPSPTASNVPFQESGYQKSLYEKAKMKLINKLPQYV